MLPLIKSIWVYVYFYIRPVIKWFLRRTTNLCELQRICYGEEKGAPRTLKVEFSLCLSRTEEIIRMVSQLKTLAEEGRFTEDTSRNCVEYSVRLVTDIKNIKVSVHRQFVDSFGTCLLQIYGYKQLIHEVEILRRVPYSSENIEHEEKLLMLWRYLRPTTPLQTRISKQWTDIGFQGEDPKTDFRGMGILGLENLLYFAREYTVAARHVLSHSSHPVYGYSFAIVGINLTSMAYRLLKAENLKPHLFNTVYERPLLRHFHHVYCYLFYEFDKFWLSEKPRDIMEFNRIRDKFEEYLLKCLANPKAALKLNIAIETL